MLLPKDGSWSLVKHEFATGQVSPVPQDLAAPLIRVGELVTKALPIGLKPGSELAYFTTIQPPPEKQLLRIANPTELLRNPAADTINYGFLQSTDTQKALFLTPAFEQGVQTLMSKTPPLFADAFRIVNSKAIFPNIGDAVSNFGDVISLLKNGNEFEQGTLTDAGKKALKLMQINDLVAGAKQEGYKLLKKAAAFDLPGTEWELIKLGDALRIYLEYKAQKQGAPLATDGKLDFDVNSFAGDVAQQWKSRMSNVAVVIDLGPIKRLMTIKGNWDSKKGAEAQYGGDPADPTFPSPQIEFAEQLQPVIEILQILQDLQGENYKDAFSKGLKLAMSNKAGSWEYKFEASKEIPVLKFPMPPFDNDPNAPLKLEAGLKLGAYFNAALTITQRSERSAAERRRLPGFLRTPLGHVRLAFDRDGLRGRPGESRHRGGFKSRADAAHEVRLRRADRGRSAGGRQRQRALHGRGRDLHRLDPAQRLGFSHVAGTCRANRRAGLGHDHDRGKRDDQAAE